MERNQTSPPRFGQAIKVNVLFGRHRDLRRELAMVPDCMTCSRWHAERRRELAAINRTLANLGITN
jgi:hypothetical protein